MKRFMISSILFSVTAGNISIMLLIYLPAFIAQLNNLGGHLLTIKPAVSLETVFFKILEQESR